MRYVTKADAAKHLTARMQQVGNIHVSGSVLGMQQQFGWAKGGQVRVGSYIYNVGVAEVERLRNLHVLRGE